MLHLLIFALLSATAMASYGYHVDPNCQACPACTPTASFLWATASSPLCLLTIAGYIMLLISPLTRVLASDFLKLLAYLATSFVKLAWRGASPADFERLKHSYDDKEVRLMRERDHAEMLHQHSVGAQEQITHENKQLKTDNAQLRSNLGDTRERLDRFQNKSSTVAHRKEKERLEGEVNSVKKEVSDLEYELRAKDRDIGDRDARIRKLETALAIKTSEKDTADHAAKDAAAREKKVQEDNNKLEAQLRQQADDHQKELCPKDKEILLHRRVLDVLHHLAEQTDPAQLPVAVVFAKALQMSNVSLIDLKIDQGRLDLLWDFVLAGMGNNLPVQPQATERGFRLKKRPYVLSGLMAQGTSLASSYNTPVDADKLRQEVHSFSDSGYGSVLRSSVLGVGSQQSLGHDQQHQAPDNTPKTSLFSSISESAAPTRKRQLESNTSNENSFMRPPPDTNNSTNDNKFMKTPLDNGISVSGWANPVMKAPVDDTDSDDHLHKKPASGSTSAGKSNPFADRLNGLNTPGLNHPFLNPTNSGIGVPSNGNASTKPATENSSSGNTNPFAERLKALKASQQGNYFMDTTGASPFASLGSNNNIGSSSPSPFASLGGNGAAMFGASPMDNGAGTSPFSSLGNSNMGASDASNTSPFASLGGGNNTGAANASPFASLGNTSTGSSGAPGGGNNMGASNMSPFASLDHSNTGAPSPSPFASLGHQSGKGNPFMTPPRATFGSTAFGNAQPSQTSSSPVGSLADNPFLKIR